MLTPSAAIVLLFTIGALTNRRGLRSRRQNNDCEASPISSKPLRIKHDLDGAPSHQPHQNPFSRLLATFPFLLEIWYWLLTYWVCDKTKKGRDTILTGT